MYRINKDLHDSAVLIDPATGLPYTAGNGLPTSGLINGTDDGGTTLRPVKTDSAGRLEVKTVNEVEETIWVDSTGTYFVRSYTNNLGVVTITYTLADGTPYVPVAPSIPAASGTDKEVATTHFVANTAGTGYSVGDLIDLTTVYDTALNTVVASIYFNLNTNAIVTPVFSDLTIIDGVDKTTVSTTFRALTTNTGYITGDIINRITTLSTVGSTTTVVSDIYENLRTNAVITPVYSEIEHIGYRTMSAAVSSFRAITAGTGFSSGDLIEKIYYLDLTGGTINVTPYYYNTTTNLSCTPLMTQIRPLNAGGSNANQILSYTHASILAIDTTSSTLLTVGTTGASHLQVTNNTGARLEIACGLTNPVVINAGGDVIFDLNIPAGTLITLTPRGAGLTTTDIVTINVY